MRGRLIVYVSHQKTVRRSDEMFLCSTERTKVADAGRTRRQTHTWPFVHPIQTLASFLYYMPSFKVSTCATSKLLRAAAAAPLVGHIPRRPRLDRLDAGGCGDKEHDQKHVSRTKPIATAIASTTIYLSQNVHKHTYTYGHTQSERTRKVLGDHLPVLLLGVGLGARGLRRRIVDGSID